MPMSVNNMERFTCEDISAVLSALLDGQLDRETAHLAEIHLADCGACRAMLDEAEENDALLRASMTFDPRDRWTSELETNMLAAVLSHQPSIDRTPEEETENHHADAPIAVIGPRRGSRFVAMSGWMTAAAAMMVVGLLLMQNRGFRAQPSDNNALATSDTTDSTPDQSSATSGQFAKSTVIDTIAPNEAAWRDGVEVVADIDQTRTASEAGERLASDSTSTRNAQYAPALAAWFPSWMPVDRRADWALGPVFHERESDPRVTGIVRQASEVTEDRASSGGDVRMAVAEADVADLFAQTEILLHVLANSDADEVARRDSDIAALIEEEDFLNRLDDVRAQLDPGARDDVNRAYYVLTRANTARDAASVSGLQRTIQAYDLSDRMAVLSEHYAE